MVAYKESENLAHSEQFGVGISNGMPNFIAIAGTKLKLQVQKSQA